MVFSEIAPVVASFRKTKISLLGSMPLTLGCTCMYVCMHT